jgi:hypothetical protein
MSDDKVTIGGALSYAWSLWTQNWRAIWGVLAFYALASTICYAGQLAQDRVLIIGGALLAVIGSLATSGAIFRIAFAKEAGDRPGFRLGPLGVQWGAMEWRMLGATLLLLLFFILVGALVVVALCALVAGLTIAKGVPLSSPPNPDQMIAALGTTGTAAIDVVGVLLYGLMIFFAGRLALAVVASAVSGKVQVLKSFALTRGHFWSILLTFVILQAPVVIIGAALRSGLGDVGTPAPPAAAFAIALAMGVFTAGVLAPLLAAALAYFYRNLRTPA